jgi:hypothetical protein
VTRKVAWAVAATAAAIVLLWMYATRDWPWWIP